MGNLENKKYELTELMKEIVETLNKACIAYYTTEKTIMSDVEYDILYDKLKLLEEETGIILANSPTQKAGYEVKSELETVIHNHPMLSLDKCHSVKEILKFADGKDIVGSVKMDGLTISLGYENGKLVSAETRGDGTVGKDVLHIIKTMKNIPITIPFTDTLTIDGEAIITYADFEKINAKIDNEEDKYKNPRNLASGTLNLLDASISTERNLKFIAWKLIKRGKEKLTTTTESFEFLKSLGFDVVPYININNGEVTEKHLQTLKTMAEEKDYPMDGVVLTYDDISYGESLGKTSKFPKHSIAYKFEDETVETKATRMEWQVSRTGKITPVAYFEPVECEGSTIECASVHNVTIFNEMQLGEGDKLLVYKANLIIPQIKENLTKSNTFKVPKKCPCCGKKVEIRRDNATDVLYCTNEDCEAKILKKLSHFVSKNAMNIDGLSDSTLEKLMDLGCLTVNPVELYYLFSWKDYLYEVDGLGKKSVDKLLDSIEKSRNVKLENFLYALGIPNVGKDASKKISELCDGDYKKFIAMLNMGYDFKQVDTFGDVIATSIYTWYNDIMSDSDKVFDYNSLVDRMNFIIPKKNEKKTKSDKLANKTICVTGKLNHYKNRDDLVADIEINGGKVTGGVTKKTDYLLTNDTESGSGKNKKAKELNIPIISEEDFMKMIGKML